MKTFTYISILFLLGSVQGQFGVSRIKVSTRECPCNIHCSLMLCVFLQGFWNGGAFNPWNNPNHPAHRGIANGIAARNYFAWPAAPYIRPGPIPSVIADSPALNSGEFAPLIGARKNALEYSVGQ